MGMLERLEKMHEKIIRDIPDNLLEDIQNATEEIVESGVLNNASMVGTKAPYFKINDVDGKLFDSKKLLVQKPIIISFFRGSWCPFCNIELESLKDCFKDFSKYGTIVAISSQISQISKKIKKEKKLPFPVICDENNILAKKFGIAYKVPIRYRKALKSMGIEWKEFHKGNELPVAATFIISKNNKIAFSYVNIDYTQRADPNKIIKVLKTL